jgi:hypothetical protein
MMNELDLHGNCNHKKGAKHDDKNNHGISGTAGDWELIETR